MSTALAAFLEPRRGRRMSEETTRAIDDRIETGKTIRKRKRAYKALAKTLCGHASFKTEAEAFDRQGHARFLCAWREELDLLSETDRLEIETGVTPYFGGRLMDQEWRDILAFLNSLRAKIKSAMNTRSPAHYHCWGAPTNCGW